ATGVSNKKVDEILKQANEYAAQGLKIDVSLKPGAIRLVEHEGNRTLIAECDVKGSEAYYQRFQEFLKKNHGIDIALTPPPFHVTLYTGENGKAIGIPTAKDMNDRSKPLDAKDAELVAKNLGRPVVAAAGGDDHIAPPPPSSGPPSSGPPSSEPGGGNKAWIKIGEQILPLSNLGEAGSRMVVSSENGSFATGQTQDAKSVLSIHQGPRVY